MKNKAAKPKDDNKELLDIFNEIDPNRFDATDNALIGDAYKLIAGAKADNEKKGNRVPPETALEVIEVAFDSDTLETWREDAQRLKMSLEDYICNRAKSFKIKTIDTVVDEANAAQTAKAAETPNVVEPIAPVNVDTSSLKSLFDTPKAQNAKAKTKLPNWAWVVIGVIGVGVLAYLVYFLIQKYKIKTPVNGGASVSTPPIKTPKMDILKNTPPQLGGDFSDLF